MIRWRAALDRVRALWHPQRVDDDIDEELHFHIAMRTEENRRRGMNSDDARRSAQLAFGRMSRVKELAHDVRGGGWLETLRQDLRYAVRVLRRSPAFTIAVVLSLGLGIGANTALFSAADTLFFESLPVRSPSELVTLSRGRGAELNYTFSYPIFAALRDRTRELHGTFAFADAPDLDLVARGVGQLAKGEFVSGDYFATLGVDTERGRLLSAGDDHPAQPPVIVLDYGYANRRFGPTGEVVGKSIDINGVPVTVVGVVSRTFRGLRAGDSPDFYAPLSMWESITGRTGELSNAADFWLDVVGRRGSQDAAVRTDLNAALRSSITEIFPGRSAKRYGEILERFSVDVVPAAFGAQSPLRVQFGSPIRILIVVVALVLLLACANVAGLLLSRGAARRPEIGMRVALGASRGRIVQQLLTEYLTLAALGAVVGCIVGVLGCASLRAMASTSSAPIAISALPNMRVLAFTAALACVSGVLLGAVPAWVSARNATRGVGTRANARTTAVPLGRFLVIGQVALSLTLVITATLFAATLRSLRGVDSGFERDNTLVFSLSPGQAGLDTARLGNLYHEITDRLNALPGVMGVALSSKLPLAGGYHQLVSIQGDQQPEEQKKAGLVTASASYFRVAATRLERGRTFSDQDDARTPRVAVISDGAAKAWFAGRNPIGQRLGFGGPERSGDIEIIGVAADGRYDSVRETSPQIVYTPLSQTRGLPRRMAVLVRTSADPTPVAAQVRRAVSAVAPTVPVEHLSTMTRILDEALVRERLLATISGFFGFIAVLLACVGLYGLIAFRVARRTREIGVRMALGATRGRIVGAVLAEGAALVVAGLSVGFLLANSATRLVAAQLYGVRATDPRLFALGGLVLVACGLGASALPARRAAGTDPVQALRAE